MLLFSHNIIVCSFALQIHMTFSNDTDIPAIETNLKPLSLHAVLFVEYQHRFPACKATISKFNSCSCAW